MRNNKLSRNVGTAIKYKVKRKSRRTHRLNRPECSTFYPDRAKPKTNEIQDTDKEV